MTNEREKKEEKPTCNSSTSNSVKGCWRLTFFPSSLTTCRMCYQKVWRSIEPRRKNIYIYTYIYKEQMPWRNRNAFQVKKYEKAYEFWWIPQDGSKLRITIYSSFDLLKGSNNRYWNYNKADNNVKMDWSIWNRNSSNNQLRNDNYNPIFLFLLFCDFLLQGHKSYIE